MARVGLNQSLVLFIQCATLFYHKTDIVPNI